MQKVYTLSAHFLLDPETFAPRTFFAGTPLAGEQDPCQAAPCKNHASVSMCTYALARILHGARSMPGEGVGTDDGVRHERGAHPIFSILRSSSRPNGRLGGRLPGRLVQKTSWSSQRRRSKAACWGTGSSPQTSKTVAQNAKVNTRRPDVARQTPSNSPLKSYT